MAPQLCGTCHNARAQIVRPKTGARVCSTCFIAAFEAEVAETITSTALFHRGEKIAIGASGGKDSTVLASVLVTLNARHDWGLDLCLLSIDEGIAGYRDHSLAAVRRSAKELPLPLTIVSYAELYGWSMDQVVAQIGKKGNCTYCGVFRRQALDRGAARLGVKHVVTGHNADDVAETVLMNLLRGDLPRLSRATGIVTGNGGSLGESEKDRGEDAISLTSVKRSKPLMFAYEKEIVLYAHHRKLDYFSTECLYSPEAFRGSARSLIKSLERVRPESILDIVRSGIDMARLVPGIEAGAQVLSPNGKEEREEGGCGSAAGASGDGGDMASMEKRLRDDELAKENGTELEVRIETLSLKKAAHRSTTTPSTISETTQKHSASTKPASADTVPIRTKRPKQRNEDRAKDVSIFNQKLGQCSRCGYLSSQPICKACVLLEGLNKARPRTEIEIGGGDG